MTGFGTRSSFERSAPAIAQRIPVRHPRASPKGVPVPYMATGLFDDPFDQEPIMRSPLGGPGHLGELTQIVPFEMVDQALVATGTAQARVRVLPSRVVVYLLLAGCLFAGPGYRQVWHKLTAGLGGRPAARASDNALWQARARLGAAPLRWLFDLLRGPVTGITAGPARWRGLLVCAIDGTTMTIPDSPGTWPPTASKPAATAALVIRCCG
jgi:hypothetical protein